MFINFDEYMGEKGQKQASGINYSTALTVTGKKILPKWKHKDN